MDSIHQEEFSEETFKLTFDSNQDIKDLVHRFDKNGIELKTKNTTPEQGAVDGDTGSNVVSQMAQRATDKAMAS